MGGGRWSRTNLLRPYFPLSFVASLGTTISQSTIRLELALFVRDLARFFVDKRIGERKLGAGGRSGKVVALSNNGCT